MTSKLKVYVATAFGFKDELAKPWVEKLRAAGCEITHDWTSETAPMAGETTLDSQTQESYAEADLWGVRTADVLWFISPPTSGAGCFVELGYALGLQDARCAQDSAYADLEVVASGPRRTIFQTLTDELFETHEEAFEYILRLQRERE